MTKDEFKNIWNISLKPLGIRLDKTHKSINFYENEDEFIWKEYERIRKEVHQHYMLKSDKLIDRHKIGAILAVAIAVKQPIRLKNKASQDTSFGERMANAAFAFDSGLSVIMDFKIKALKEAKAFKTAEILEKKRFFLPNRDKYGVDTIKLIHYLSDYTITNVFCLANILYLLEIYHLEKCGVSSKLILSP